MTVQKEDVVKTFECIAEYIDAPTKTADGARIWGGHSLRVTGAQHLSLIGIEMVIIALLARWQSAIVMRYAAEAPLAHVDNDYRHKLHSFNLKKFMKKIKDDQHSAEAATMKLHEEHKALIHDEINKINQQPQIMSTANQTTTSHDETAQNVSMYFIENDNSHVHHRPRIHTIAVCPAIWETMCGWKFGSTLFTIRDTLDTAESWKQICTTCMPAERRRRRLSEKGTDQTTSASSPSSASSTSDDE